MESSDGVNCSQMNFTNRSCFQFDETGFQIVIWCRTGFSILGTVMSAVAILLIIRLKAWKKVELNPAARLALYLCVASLFNGIITVISTIVPVYNRLICDYLNANSFCTAASFLITYSVWAILVLMVWIYVQIIMAVLTDSERYGNSNFCRKYANYRDSIFYDGCVLATTLFIPIIFSIIPLTDTNPKLYGLAGAWCWIRARDDKCQDILAGIIEQFALWYAWVMAFSLVFVVTVVVVGVILYKTKQYARDADKDQYDRYLRDIRPLAIYPIVFTVIYGYGCANRILYAFREETILWLWIPHGIADAFVSVMIPLFFLLHHQMKLNQLPPEREPLLRNGTN